MITQPSPTDALCQDVPRFLLSLRRLQENFVNPLKPCAAIAARQTLQASVELPCAFAGDQPYVGEILTLKVLSQSAFHPSLVKQAMLMPLLRFQRYDKIFGQRPEAVPSRRMSRNEGSELIEGKSGSASHIETQDDRITGVWRVVHNQGREAPLGATTEFLTLPPAQTFVRLNRQ